MSKRAVAASVLLLTVGLVLVIVGTLLATGAISDKDPGVLRASCAERWLVRQASNVGRCLSRVPAAYVAPQGRGRGWPMIVLGVILLIPGLYHVRIAYKAYRGDRRYVYAEIEEFDDAFE